jgi:hypothetical protein
MNPVASSPRPGPRLRSPLARAIVPVAAGLAFFAALFGVTYLIARVASHNTSSLKLGAREFTIGRVDIAVARIVKHGPLLYADLKGTVGAQAIVIDHDPNAIDTQGWSVYFAYLAARGPSCLASIDPVTQHLQDCQGHPIGVGDLAPGAPAAQAVVSGGKYPVVSVVFAAAQPSASTTSSTLTP